VLFTQRTNGSDCVNGSTPVKKEHGLFFYGLIFILLSGLSKRIGDYDE
jgi:hypothetical protein